MRDDTISRAAALDFVSAMNFCDEISDEAYQKLTVHFENLPSATDTNVATTDTISKAAVVDAIEGVDWYHQNKNGEMVHGANSNEHQAWYKSEDIYTAIETVPSAQPEITNEEIRFVLKQLRVYFAIKIRDGKDGGVPVELLKLVEEIQEYFENTSSAQPRWIPVTERLPTENNSYLVWMPYTPEGHHITVAEWCGSYWNIKTPIMAWMPLPTPYQEGDDKHEG